MDKQYYATMALAGAAQACNLVRSLAHQGRYDDDAYKATVSSLLVIDCDNPEDIYGGLSGLRHGIEVLEPQLKGERGLEHQEITRYLISLVALQKRLAKNPQMMQMLSERLTQIQKQAQHFNPTHENVIAAEADLYADTISSLGPKIQVTGNPLYLQSAGHVNKVRALLLSGIRSIMLWRQMGGSSLNLIFKKKKMLQYVEQMKKDML
ncbi:high frequency lysogenization protein HflD [Pelagibaculum spongiae]|uniref:High frequency lysogenization protein HflD homolog n=1 Tax=Pelagibaculum spongiae TaxID=2080658 RepID=A0A2V1GYJ2_9GAMM|nr:high frequency lysogenization protein HflD [Pelagibaculum spongiae]PVZ71499.1 lysogenization regulator HflD [Pelagibaculum spongiae]